MVSLSKKYKSGWIRLFLSNS